jgi:RNA polymerase sigma-70 factor (ECF subfamily)
MDQKNAQPPPFHGVDDSEAQRQATLRPAIEGFPEIFQQHARFLWRTLVNLGVPSHEAQDLCQEVMLTVHRRLPDFDGRSLRGWLYGICVRTASDYRRSARVRREVPHRELPDSGLDAEQPEQLERSRQLERVLGALSRLSEDKRAAFVLYEVEELTLAEISEALGVPLQTVYSRIKSAREALRSELVTEASPQQGAARETG